MGDPAVVLPEPNDGPNVCEICMAENLVKKGVIYACARCGNAFCIHFASKIDVQYCIDCMSDISVTENNITKTYEHERYDEVTDTVQTIKFSRRAKQIKIEGMDWLFAQRKVKDFSTDVELAMAIEYHQTYCRMLIAESEERRTAKAHRFAGVKMQMPSASSSVTTTVNKSTQAKSTQAQAKVSALVQVLLAKGMTMDQIMKILKGGKP